VQKLRVDQGKGQIETSRPEASSSIIISQYPDTGQFVLGDNLPPMYANADTLTSCNPQQKDDSHQELGLGMIIRNLTPISDKDEPTKQAKTTSSKSCML
jgi:hypothetical protein